MGLLTVGGPYVPGKTSIQPGTNYNFRSGTHELLLLIEQPTKQEIDAVKRGQADFGFMVHERVIFFLYRFEGGFDWSDCPYSIWQLPEAERIAPANSDEHTPETRALLEVVLVDASKNRVEAFRAVSLAPSITRELHKAIEQQLFDPISDVAYRSAIQSAYRKWPTTDSMIAIAHRGQGGA